MNLLALNCYVFYPARPLCVTLGRFPKLCCLYCFFFQGAMVRVVLLKGCWETRGDGAEKPRNTLLLRGELPEAAQHTAPSQAHCPPHPGPGLPSCFSCWELGLSPRSTPTPSLWLRGSGAQPAGQLEVTGGWRRGLAACPPPLGTSSSSLCPIADTPSGLRCSQHLQNRLTAPAQWPSASSENHMSAEQAELKPPLQASEFGAKLSLCRVLEFAGPCSPTSLRPCASQLPSYRLCI